MDVFPRLADMADLWAGGVHTGRRCLCTSASRCYKLGGATWETGPNSCSFCTPLALRDAGKGGGTLLAGTVVINQGGKAEILCAEQSSHEPGRKSSDFVC